MTRGTLSRFAGPLLVLDAAIHALIGIAIYAGALRDIAGAGFLNAVHPYRDREAAWWFFVTGLLYLTLGAVVWWLRAHDLPVPAFLGWILVGLGVVGMLLAPSAGWPFIAAAGVLVLLSPHRTAPAVPAALAEAG